MLHNLKAASILIAAQSWLYLWLLRAFSGPRLQPTQLTPVLPRHGQKLRQVSPLGARSALMGLSSQGNKQKHAGTKTKNWPRTTPSPSNAGRTKLVQKLHTVSYWPLMSQRPRVRAYGQILATRGSDPPSFRDRLGFKASTACRKLPNISPQHVSFMMSFSIQPARTGALKSSQSTTISARVMQ
jgi:hypothetical protein